MSPEIHYPDGAQPPEPSAQTAVPIAQTSPIDSLVGLSGSSLGEPPKPKRPRRWLRWLLGTLTFILIVVAGIIAFYGYSLTLHSTTYTNGRGQKYKLLYYPLSKNVSTSNLEGYKDNKLDTSAYGAFLVSQVQHDNLRLTIGITKRTSDPQLTKEKRPSICTSNAFTVHINSTGYDAPVCALSVGDIPIMYFFELKSGSSYYLGIIAYDYTTPANSDQAAALIRSLDLRNSQKDIIKIISSVVPQE